MIIRCYVTSTDYKLVSAGLGQDACYYLEAKRENGAIGFCFFQDLGFRVQIIANTSKLTCVFRRDEAEHLALKVVCTANRLI